MWAVFADCCIAAAAAQPGHGVAAFKIFQPLQHILHVHSCLIVLPMHIMVKSCALPADQQHSTVGV